jgi:hypothetical protein
MGDFERHRSSAHAGAHASRFRPALSASAWLLTYEKMTPAGPVVGATEKHHASAVEDAGGVTRAA